MALLARGMSPLTALRTRSCPATREPASDHQVAQVVLGVPRGSPNYRTVKDGVDAATTAFRAAQADGSVATLAGTTSWGGQSIPVSNLHLRSPGTNTPMSICHSGFGAPRCQRRY
jgi:hypothetical protein